MFRRRADASRGPSGSSAYKRLRRDADDDSDVLLPLHGEVPRFRSMVPSQELKFLDTYLTFSALSVDSAMTGGIIAPSGVASIPTRGTAANQFQGRGIVIKNWSVRGSFDLAREEAMATPCEGRLAFIALVLDTKSNGSQCTSQQVFVNPGNTIAGMCSPLVNLLYSNRFVILGRKTFLLNPETLTNDYEIGVPPTYQQSGVRVPFEFFCPMDVVVNFKAFTGAISDIVDNSLHVVMFSSYYDTNPLLNLPTTSGGYSSRIRFLDAP